LNLVWVVRVRAKEAIYITACMYFLYTNIRVYTITELKQHEINFVRLCMWL
jgi:hypothetical protein